MVDMGKWWLTPISLTPISFYGRYGKMVADPNILDPNILPIS